MKSVKFRNIDISIGDKLKVIICKDVEVTGKVVFEDAAYCLEYFAFGANRTNPLTSYAHTCEFIKL